MKKKQKIKHRIPLEVILTIHSKGGAQSPKKGKKGYSRIENKKLLRKELDFNSLRSVYFCANLYRNGGVSM